MILPQPSEPQTLHRWPPEEYKAEHHQIDFHNAWKIAKYRWLCSGIGGGKTVCGIMEDFKWATTFPGCSGVIVVPKFDVWYSNLYPEVLKWWPPEGTVWNWSDKEKTIVIKIGKDRSLIRVRSAWNKKQVNDLLGPSYTWFHIEEAARMGLGEVAWKHVTGRLRETVAPIRGGWVTGSPMGFNWLTDAFGIETALPEMAYIGGIVTRRVVDEKSKKETVWWVRGAESEWNTALADDYVPSLLAVYGGDQRFLDQELRGRIISQEGLIYYNWCKPLHVVPHEVALALLKRCKTFHGGGDWGETAPAALTAGGTTKGGWENGIMVITDEYYAPQTSAEQLGAIAWEWTNKYRQEIPGFEEFRWYFDPAEPGSIRKLQTGFTTEDGVSHLPVPGVINPGHIPGKAWNQWKPGIDAVRVLLGFRRDWEHPAYPKPNKLGGSRLYVSERCVNLINEFRIYRQIPIEAGKPEREGAVGPSHALDTLRYQRFGEMMIFSPDYNQYKAR